VAEPVAAVASVWPGSDQRPTVGLAPAAGRSPTTHPPRKGAEQDRPGQGPCRRLQRTHRLGTATAALRPRPGWQEGPAGCTPRPMLTGRETFSAGGREGGG
jgi:hypothetical protein